jgi:hypothetical protein
MLVFSVVVIFFHAIESIAVGVWHGNTLEASIPPILGRSRKGFSAVGFSCFVLLIRFFGFREMARVLGRREMRNLLFGKKQAAHIGA